MFWLSGNVTVHNLLQNPNISNISAHLCKLYSRKAMRGTFVSHPNPGLQKQLELYKDIHLPDEKTQMVDENFEDSLESDFMESGKVYEQHKWEKHNEKESRHLKNIGRKYFKEKKNPNLLTWGEKEQIRYLHEMDREEWSVERLAVSFPASEDIIKKVLNSTWKPENAARILTHDEHVRKNWSLLTEGKLHINSDLKAHVSKFTSRRDLITSKAETAAVATPQKPRGKVPEFSNIIKQYNDLLGENGEIKNEICESFSSKENYVPFSRKMLKESSLDTEKRHFTLNEYKGNHTSKSELNEVQESNEPGNEVIQLEATSMVKFRPKNISVKKHASVMNQLKRINDDNIVDKINIPRNKWQAGATYKVKDCYYDDDGRFLYRVPGMIHE